MEHVFEPWIDEGLMRELNWMNIHRITSSFLVFTASASVRFDHPTIPYPIIFGRRRNMVISCSSFECGGPLWHPSPRVSSLFRRVKQRKGTISSRVGKIVVLLVPFCWTWATHNLTVWWAFCLQSGKQSFICGPVVFLMARGFKSVFCTLWTRPACTAQNGPCPESRLVSQLFRMGANWLYSYISHLQEANHQLAITRCSFQRIASKWIFDDSCTSRKPPERRFLFSTHGFCSIKTSQDGHVGQNDPAQRQIWAPRRYDWSGYGQFNKDWCFVNRQFRECGHSWEWHTNSKPKLLWH